jgi:hypothetical protein
MDGGRRAHLDGPKHRDTKDVSVPSPALRCGWCGLLPLPEQRMLVEDHQLCDACFDILRGVDWRCVLNEGQHRV